jgi:hypothetical protein
MIRPVPLKYRLRSKAWLSRFDRIMADLNIVLAVFAIGLAALDGTILIAKRGIDRLPQMTRVTYVEATTAVSALPAGQKLLP